MEHEIQINLNKKRMYKVLESISQQINQERYECLDLDTRINLCITDDPQNEFSVDDLLKIKAVRIGLMPKEGNEDLVKRYIKKLIRQENIYSVNDGRWDRNDLAEFCLYLFNNYNIIPTYFNGRIELNLRPELLTKLANKFHCYPSGDASEETRMLTEHLKKEYKNQKQK